MGSAKTDPGALISIKFFYLDIAYFVIIAIPRLDNLSERLRIGLSPFLQVDNKYCIWQIQIHLMDATRTSERLSEALYATRSENGDNRQFDLHVFLVSIE